MPEANSAPILSNPPIRLPTPASDPAQKSKLLNRLRESLRSRQCSPRPDFLRGLLHLTHAGPVTLNIPSPRSYQVSITTGHLIRQSELTIGNN